jgi:hypothetical protein
MRAALVLAALSASLFGGCAASTPQPGDGETPVVETDAMKAANVFACKVDADCVAVPKAGCCHNGWDEAVNKTKVAEYDKLYTPKVCKVMCPMYIVDDTRVAECNTGTNKCEMVEPTAIRCGGFTRNPHSCPKGFSCKFGGVPDVPGTCVAK